MTHPYLRVMLLTSLSVHPIVFAANPPFWIAVLSASG